MSFIDGLRHRISVLIRRGDYEREIDAEMAFHLSLDEAQQDAPDAADAPGAARRRFGNVGYFKEEARRVAGLGMLDGLAQDARYLVRSLRRAPGFAAVAILTLGLGIGATTTVMSVADHLLVRPLPYRSADRLMVLVEHDTDGTFRLPSAPTVADWRADAGVRKAFEDVGFARLEGASFQMPGYVRRRFVAYVSGAFMPLLGATPALGRGLTENDERPDAPPAVVLSHDTWERAYGSDASVIGRRVAIDGVSTTIVGVMPVGATYPEFAEAWLPVTRYPRQMILGRRRGPVSDTRAIGRLRPGVDSAQAVALMQPVVARLAAAYPEDQARWNIELMSTREELQRGLGSLLLTLAAAALAVLLLACVNVASLSLVRIAVRTRELAVRRVLGASRGRLFRQLLTESLGIALVGGVLGTLLAAGAVSVTRSRLALQIPRISELAIDHRVLLIAAAASVFTALVCGIWPALRASDMPNGGRAESRAQRTLVTVQFALAMALLVGAGLLLQSFRRAATGDLGFDRRGLVVLPLNSAPGPYERPADAAAFYARLMQVARTVPGVEGVAFINHFPFFGGAATTPVEIDGRPALDGAPRSVFYRTVSDGYLETMKMSLAGGRWFNEADMRSPGGAFVVNEAMAARYWPGENAVGKRITVRRSLQARVNFGEPLPGVVVGVVGNVRQNSLDHPPDPEVYVPYTLEVWAWGNLVVRTRDGAKSIPALQAAVATVDRRPVVSGTTGQGFLPVDAGIAASLTRRKLPLTLVGAFAACAVLLAAMGLYGVVAYGIERRITELGVRKALGATDRMITRLVVRDSFVPIGTGVAIGAAGAFLGARLIHTLLYDTSAADPVVYGTTVVVLSATAIAASYLPARRAARLDPTIAMRGD